MTSGCFNRLLISLSAHYPKHGVASAIEEFNSGCLSSLRDRTPMIIKLPPERQLLYNRLNASSIDIGFARYCASMIQKKKWHLPPWTRRRTQYPQQSAFTLALVVSYFRPFTRTHGWPDLPSDLASTDLADVALHSKLKDLRNKVYAHSSEEYHSARPWDSGEFQTIIQHAPAFVLEADDIEHFLTMTLALQQAITTRMKEIVEATGARHA